MKKPNLLALCGAMLFLAGCPYKSGQQLGSPSAKTFDQALLGTWLGCAPENKTECGRLEVYSFNGTEYYAELTNVERSEQSLNIRTDRYRAFFADTGVPGLLDVQELSISTAANKNHFYVKAELLPGGGLALAYVSDEFVKTGFPDEKELADHFRRNYSKPGFFETLPPFERVKK